VGDIHYPLHMRAKHAEAIVLAREGGPGSYEVSTPTLLAARYRPHSKASNRASPFPTALRYGTVKENRLNHEFNCALKGIMRLPLKPRQSKQQQQLPSKKEAGFNGEEEDDWRDVKLCDDENPVHGGKRDEPAIEGEEWEGVEIEEEKEEKTDGALNDAPETPPSKAEEVVAATLAADMSEAERGAKKLAAELRAIGRRRALEAVIYGERITPIPGEGRIKVVTPQGKLKWRG
jgi:hypothetical protein